MYLSIPAVGNFITNTEPIFYAIEEKMSENKFRKVNSHHYNYCTQN